MIKIGTTSTFSKFLIVSNYTQQVSATLHLSGTVRVSTGNELFSHCQCNLLEALSAAL